MNATLLGVVAAGALIALGVTIVVSALRLPVPELSVALVALDERRPVEAGAERSWGTRLLLMTGRAQLGVDAADLALIGLTRDRFIVGRALSALAYGAVGPALVIVLLMIDESLAVVVPSMFTIAGFGVGWVSYRRLVVERADRARDELRYALVSYLQQVSLLRHGGAGVATALRAPARYLADSWAMRRVHDELVLAERLGEMPWEGLRRLGAGIGIPELRDLGTIAGTAGADGGAIMGTLLSRAESLHDELLADEHAAANRATGRMSTPGALQVFLIAAWVLYPAGTALLTSL